MYNIYVFILGKLFFPVLFGLLLDVGSFVKEETLPAGENLSPNYSNLDTYAMPACSDLKNVTFPRL